MTNTSESLSWAHPDTYPARPVLPSSTHAPKQRRRSPRRLRATGPPAHVLRVRCRSRKAAGRAGDLIDDEPSVQDSRVLADDAGEQ